MENTSNGSKKLWIGFGIITIISGVILALEKPLIGIPGVIVGIWLVVVNMRKIKSKNRQQDFQDYDFIMDECKKSFKLGF